MYVRFDHIFQDSSPIATQRFQTTREFERVFHLIFSRSAIHISSTPTTTYQSSYQTNDRSDFDLPLSNYIVQKKRNTIINNQKKLTQKKKKEN